MTITIIVKFYSNHTATHKNSQKLIQIVYHSTINKFRSYFEKEKQIANYWSRNILVQSKSREKNK